MYKTLLVLIILLASVSSPVAADEDYNESFMSVEITPGYGFPLGSANTDFFSSGPICDAIFKYKFQSMPFLYAGLKAGYDFIPVELQTAVSVISIGPEAGIIFDPVPWFSISAGFCGGYFYSFLNNGAAQGGGNPFIKPSLGLTFLLSPGLSLGLGGTYRNYLGLYQGAAVSLAGVIRIKRSEEGTGPVIYEPVPLIQAKQSERLGMKNFTISEIFPVFYSYYDDHPIGAGTIFNNTDDPVENISLNFFIKKYMDNPKTCSSPESLGPGKEGPLELFALFTDEILDVTEGTKVSAELTLSYRHRGRDYQENYIETVRIYNRNATTWNDDRKVAAFVTAKEPVVLAAAKTAAAIARENGRGAVSMNIRTAVALNELLRLYGMSYVIDPETQNVSSDDETVLDFLQFPRQTLQYGAGDCDDLSILNCALFESVGIETAFITVPGHIFIAFDSGLNGDEAASIFSSSDDFIMDENTVWVPYEITELEEGFNSAWRKGAKQWREAQAAGSAALYPTHDAWKTFEPVGLPGSAEQLPMPQTKAVEEAFMKEFNSVVESEIFLKVNAVEERIAANGETPKLLNRLGTLYARYGLTAKAEKIFLRILSLDSDYLPALVNIGNIMLLESRFTEALAYYEKAEGIKPENTAVLLGLARTHHELENYGFVNSFYRRLKEANPQLAEQFEYLDPGREESARAISVKDKNTMIWEETLQAE